MLHYRLIVVAAVATALTSLSGCGEENGEPSSRSAPGQAEYCPPDKKGSGISVASRYDYEDLLEAGKWRTEIFPRRCAGELGAIVPDLPDGYGLAPSSRPYIMNADHIYLEYADMEGVVDNGEAMDNVPQGNDRIFFEISRYSADELARLRQWMAENPDNYLTRTVDGQTVYLMAGVGIFFQERTIRVPAGLTAIYDNGLLIRLSHASMFTRDRDAPVDPLALGLFRDMMQRAEASGI
ncbi:MAG: hypothetical protein AAF311_04105 [Pseudomonadota bacterium]